MNNNKWIASRHLHCSPTTAFSSVSAVFCRRTNPSRPRRGCRLPKHSVSRRCKFSRSYSHAAAYQAPSVKVREAKPRPSSQPELHAHPTITAIPAPALHQSSRPARMSRLPEPSYARELPVRAAFCLGPFSLVLDSLDQVILERGISPVKGLFAPTSTSGKTSLLGKRDFTVRIRFSKFQPDCLSVSSGYTTNQFVLGVPLGPPKTSYVPLRSHVARFRERANSWAEAEVRAKASWRMTKSDRGKMLPRRGTHRGGGREGREAGCTQPEEQPTVQTANPTAHVTQADFTAMKQRYQDMLQATLAPFLSAQQTQTAPPPAPVEAQPTPDQLSA
ncbi:histone H2B.3-like [Cucumis melo var. makuwa]|uniref:Histone H2B.3-like n=1 Tax=Cucumis melo var. makuwa TaxID=1194695 RepID=A0A5A7U1B1_CUCMM|nr:histone H2B.3-like [Cucumis melo var. makuwa]TYK15993.1 histone H2B.3-like [Cucumis melo var. makuwa]